jgi:hypothetical protein
MTARWTSLIGVWHQSPTAAAAAAGVLGCTTRIHHRRKQAGLKLPTLLIGQEPVIHSYGGGFGDQPDGLASAKTRRRSENAWIEATRLSTYQRINATLTPSPAVASAVSASSHTAA